MNTATQRCLQRILQQKKLRLNNLSRRGIFSQHFEIREAWDQRLEAPVFHKIKMGEYFVELDRKFNNEYRGSAIDIDIFANNVKSSAQAEHMEELLHKLRRTPHTIHTSDSTHHAAVRSMLDHGEVNHLVRILDDRMNYGLFLDEFTAILTLDKLLESGDVRAAARCASQLMYQEDLYPLPTALGNLSCWRYVASGRSEPWFYDHEIEVDPNPEEVVRVRVRVVPNNYHDQHFDLREPDQILGKTLLHFNAGNTDLVSRSLAVLGHHLMGNESAVREAKGEIAAAVLAHLPPQEGLKGAEVDLDDELVARARQIHDSTAEQLIDKQKKLYADWIQQRDEELQRQYERMQRSARLEAISQTKLELAEQEQKLFFFDNRDRYEMEKEEKVKQWVRTLPRTDWNMSSYPQKAYYKKKLTADGERKPARWEKLEKKRGPPK